MEAQNSTTADKRGYRRELVGVVASNKMQKTVVVTVERRILNKKFGKYEIRRARYKAHVENGELAVGDRVLIVESRPMSADKRWRVRKLLERARSA